MIYAKYLTRPSLAVHEIRLSKCGTLIHKLEGCNQMFCTMKDCHTPFNWKTGLIINGPIHNPHYFDFMAQQNATIINNPGYNPCGGIPYFQHFRNIVLKIFKDNDNKYSDHLYHYIDVYLIFKIGN